jgi:hypothetical protein
MSISNLIQFANRYLSLEKTSPEDIATAQRELLRSGPECTPIIVEALRDRLRECRSLTDLRTESKKLSEIQYHICVRDIERAGDLLSQIGEAGYCALGPLLRNRDLSIAMTSAILIHTIAKPSRCVIRSIVAAPHTYLDPDVGAEVRCLFYLLMSMFARTGDDVLKEAYAEDGRLLGLESAELEAWALYNTIYCVSSSK